MLWLVAGVFVIGLPLAAELGARVHKRVFADTETDPTGAGLLLGGATGLLALLIGFTFAMSAERFETRRQLVVSEANAIATTYRRDGLFDTPYAERLQASVARYAQSRLAFFDARENSEKLAAAARRTSVLEDAIWRETGEALRLPQSAPLATAVLISTNEMFDLAATREAAHGARVPTAIIWALSFCAFGTAGLCGYTLNAGGHRHLAASTALFVLIALALVLVDDLDAPREGMILVPQEPLINAVADITAQEARRLAAAPSALDPN